MFRPSVLTLCLPALLAVGGCAHHKKHHVVEDPNLTQADLPPAVEKIFLRDHSTAAVKMIDRRVDDGVVEYRIIYLDTDGSRHVATYDREGDVLDNNPADGSSNNGPDGGSSQNAAHPAD